MKICPKCHKTYDDSMNFCTSCGFSLENAADSCLHSSEPTSGNTPGNMPPPIHVPHKKTGILKKFIISIALLLLAIFVIGNHLNNATTYLRVEPNRLMASKGGGEIKVNIDYDGYFWSIKHKPDWVDLEEESHYLTIQVKPNRSGVNRQDRIIVKSGKVIAQIGIMQSGVATFIQASQNSLHFSKKGGTRSVLVKTDGCNWTAQYPDYMKVSKDNDSTLTVSLLPNKGIYHNGNLVLKEDNKTWVINVIQGGICDHCQATGETICTACYGTGGSAFSPCYYCGGTGKQKCRVCGGSGEVQ